MPTRYRDWQPTAWDSASNFVAFSDLSDYRNWYVLPVINLDKRQNDAIGESNFRVAKQRCEDWMGADEWDVLYFKHWAVGHEIILVHPHQEDFVIEMEDELENYPILDEMDLSELEDEWAHERWHNLCLSDRVDICRRFGISIFAARRADEIPNDDTGGLRDYLSRP